MKRLCPICRNNFEPNTGYGDGTFELYCYHCACAINSFDGNARRLIKFLMRRITELEKLANRGLLPARTEEERNLIV